MGARLDDLGRETGQLQGRVDELRRRVDTLALQFDAGGAPRGTSTGPRARPRPWPSGRHRQAPRRATSTRPPTSTSPGELQPRGGSVPGVPQALPEHQPRRERTVLDWRVAFQPGPRPPGPGRGGPGRPGARARRPGVPEGRRRLSPGGPGPRGALQGSPGAGRARPFPLAEARLQFLVDQFPAGRRRPRRRRSWRGSGSADSGEDRRGGLRAPPRRRSARARRPRARSRPTPGSSRP